MEDSDHQSGALVIGFNDDLLTEILIRLPVTSVLRFKSVSKHWRSLLTHTHFTHRYDNNNNNNLSISPGLFAGNIYVPFDVENRSPPPFRSLDFYFNRSHVTIVQSCNGLLLCYAFHNHAREYYVFNPTTKQLAFIPPAPKRHTCFTALAFHQIHCVQYKVVSVCLLNPHENMFQIQVYSSDTRKWKVCVESFSVPRPIFLDPVYWNGAVYWPPYFRNRKYLYFKIDDEQLQTLPLPEGLVFDDALMYFGESRGHLHLILHKHHKPNTLIMNVYEMLMDRSGWFVRYQVELDVLRGNFPKLNFRVLDVVRGKDEEEIFLVIPTPGKIIIMYNVHDKSIRELCRYEYDFVHIHRYIETLSSF